MEQFEESQRLYSNEEMVQSLISPSQYRYCGMKQRKN